ncbi:hypothetical protein ACIBAC_11275 [Streptomyces sp. NPDC051362]|uniref:hypothetical protein n=1 Tax=Streptomyces sp. NPDC051362 TaxID=3365651 RepID=UPI00379BAE59
MNINHRAEAERHLSTASYTDRPGGSAANPAAAAHHLAMAQVHATLAAAETAAADTASYRHTIHTLRFALVRQVAEGLALSEGDEAHQHAAGLARHLASVDLNIDAEVDAYIEGIWGDPKDARLTPTERKAKWMAEPTPWDVQPTPEAAQPPF